MINFSDQRKVTWHHKGNKKLFKRSKQTLMTQSNTIIWSCGFH
jgi:hypothetical protein